LLPIAASCVAVSAWGAASGKARQVLDRLEHLVGVTASTPAPARAAPAKLAARSPAALAPSEQALPAAKPEAELARPAPITQPPVSSARAAASVAASSLSAERVDPTLTLYRIAHAAHFVDREPARALTAWDAYLEAAPNGAFAPEARYNRALSLIRLGRAQEARGALQPFANGAYGGYRKAEASALLERIEP